MATLNTLIPLTDYQVKIYQETLSSLEQNGQGALDLFPGGGKSFIGARIVCRQLVQNKDMHIVWLSTAAANKNVASSVLHKLPYALKCRIHQINYDQLSRGPISLGKLKGRIGLVVLDECHRALARLAYPNVLQLLKDCDCNRLAMSATNKRTDGRESFKILVPDATYGKYDYLWGADNNIINMLNYFVCTTRISALDYYTLDRYKELGETYSEIYRECLRVESLIKNYKFNFRRDVTQAIKGSNMDLSGEKGDRHIVFFNRVDTLNSYKDTIFDIYSELYPNCTVRVHEYHSKMRHSEAKDVLDIAVNSNPQPYVVDVILTVNKGTESLHPRGIKSIMMFRNTQSNIVFTQQIGRAVTLTSFSSNPTYIFDFSDGCVSLLRGTSIEYGRRKTGDRLSNYKEVQSLDEMESQLKRSLSKGIKVKTEFMTPELRKMSELLNNIQNSQISAARIELLLDIKKKLLKLYPDMHHDIESIQSNLIRAVHEDTIELPDSKDINMYGLFSNDFILWFRATVSAVYNMRLDSNLMDKIKLLGHTFYLNSKHSAEDNEHMSMIDSVARGLRKTDNWNYAEINPTAKQNLSKLRRLNMESLISVPVCIYARDRNVDLSVDKVPFKEIRSITPKNELSTSFKAYMEELRDIKVLSQLQKEISACTDEDEDKLQELNDKAYKLGLKIKVKHYLNMVNYNSTYAKYLRHKIETTSAKQIRHSYVSPIDTEQGNMALSVINAYNSDAEIDGFKQEYVFNHYGYSDMSDYEVEMFRQLGFKTKIQYDKIVGKTKWKKLFDKALEGDIEAVIEIRKIDADRLDPYRQRLLRTTKFREAKKQTSTEAEPELLLRKAKEFYIKNDSRVKELEAAIRKGTIQAIDVALAPFSKSDKQIVKDMLLSPDDADTYWSKNTKEFRSLYNSCNSSISCSKMVLANIVEIKTFGKNMSEKLQNLLEIL